MSSYKQVKLLLIATKGQEAGHKAPLAPDNAMPAKTVNVSEEVCTCSGSLALPSVELKSGRSQDDTGTRMLASLRWTEAYSALAQGMMSKRTWTVSLKLPCSGLLKYDTGISSEPSQDSLHYFLLLPVDAMFQSYSAAKGVQKTFAE